jgi:HEAT repeat protein
MRLKNRDNVKDLGGYRCNSHGVSALGKINDTHADEPLIQALHDNNSIGRWSAVRALGNITLVIG